MILTEETHDLNGKNIVLRSAMPEDAEQLITYLKTVTGETEFLECEPDEITLTKESETEFINDHTGADGKLIMLAFVDSEHAGNCSFHEIGGSRRYKHRVSLGIALYEKFTGMGLGKLMLGRMLEIVKEKGYEQAELTVTEGNEKAYHLYQSFGFTEVGRIPKANRYDNGTYAGHIYMVKYL